MIHKMYDGRHIDVSKIVCVGPVISRGEYDFQRSPLPMEAHFRVWFQLADKPMLFECPCLTSEEKQYISMVEREFVKNCARVWSDAKSDISSLLETSKNASAPLIEAHEDELKAAHAELIALWQEAIK